MTVVLSPVKQAAEATEFFSDESGSYIDQTGLLQSPHGSGLIAGLPIALRKRIKPGPNPIVTVPNPLLSLDGPELGLPDKPDPAE